MPNHRPPSKPKKNPPGITCGAPKSLFSRQEPRPPLEAPPPRADDSRRGWSLSPGGRRWTEGIRMPAGEPEPLAVHRIWVGLPILGLAPRGLIRTSPPTLVGVLRMAAEG